MVSTKGTLGQSVRKVSGSMRKIGGEGERHVKLLLWTMLGPGLSGLCGAGGNTSTGNAGLQVSARAHCCARAAVQRWQLLHMRVVVCVLPPELGSRWWCFFLVEPFPRLETQRVGRCTDRSFEVGVRARGQAAGFSGDGAAFWGSEEEGLRGRLSPPTGGGRHGPCGDGGSGPKRDWMVGVEGRAQTETRSLWALLQVCGRWRPLEQPREHRPEWGS